MSMTSIVGYLIRHETANGLKYSLKTWSLRIKLAFGTPNFSSAWRSHGEVKCQVNLAA